MNVTAACRSLRRIILPSLQDEVGAASQLTVSFSLGRLQERVDGRFGIQLAAEQMADASRTAY